MIRSDFHTHTSFCDGKHTPEEMVLAAIDRGLATLGFSAHAWLEGGGDWCMPPEKEAEYCAEIRRLREKYRGKLNILLGIERDFYSPAPQEDYDYVIGSVHELHVGDAVVSVDESAEVFARAIETVFGGDVYAFCEAYYAHVAQVVARTNADLIGHFDLVEKFNGGGRFFDPAHPRYTAAWQQAADALLATGKPFEINFGAISRGYMQQPYPMQPIRDYLHAHGAEFILSSDSHSTDGIAYGFAAWHPRLAQAYRLREML